MAVTLSFMSYSWLVKEIRSFLEPWAGLFWGVQREVPIVDGQGHVQFLGGLPEGDVHGAVVATEDRDAGESLPRPGRSCGCGEARLRHPRRCPR